MKAVNSNMKPQPKEHIDVIKYCCQKHVTEAVKVVYLPHVEKIKYSYKTCSFCSQKAKYQLF